MQSTNRSKFEVRYAELRSGASSVIIHAAWSHSEDLTSAGKFGHNFLNLSIKPDSFDLVENGNHGDFAFASEKLNIDDTPSKALSFILENFKASYTAPMKFILPAEDGYIVRSDFLQDMMRNCPFIVKTECFLSPGQHCTIVRPTRQGSAATQPTLLDLLQSSVGAILSNGDEAIDVLDDELSNRLSWPWTIPTPIELKRIAIIGDKRSRILSPYFYETAKGCGVSVVIMDSPGHWMEDPAGPGAGLREHFVPFSGFTPENMADRIAETVRRLPYRIDGLITTRDSFIVGVARAAELLGLRTISPESYSKATDKYYTRQLSPAPTFIKVDSLDTFLPQLRAMTEPLQYPLIVKPTRCHGSEGVTRAENDDELIESLRFAFTTMKQQNQSVGWNVKEAPVIVETYIEGPEVDINMALWDGELLFSEVTENFPCAGDSDVPSERKRGFGMTGTVFPAGLPQEEIDMVTNDMLAIAQKLGLHSGVLHLEAKIHNSSVENYADKDGVQDLRQRTGGAAGGAKSFLLEVNPRVPGIPDMVGSSYVNGVNYYALQLMEAVGDEARFRIFTRGFVNKPLYHYAYTPMSISTPTSGKLPMDLGLGKVGVEEFIAIKWQWFEGGDIVPPAEQRPYMGLGYIYLRSRKSRREVLEKIAIVRHKWRLELE